MTDDNIVSLAEKRAADDCQLWTPLDALKSCIRMIEEGKIAPTAIYIAMSEAPDADGKARLPSALAGMDWVQAHGLLAVHLKRL